MTNKNKVRWYVALRAHLLDPMVRSTAPGSIGRLFSTGSFAMCCKYWLSSSPNLAAHEAPSTLLQVFFWTTGYVFANTVVRTASGHMDKRWSPAVVPDIIDQSKLGKPYTQQPDPVVSPAPATVTKPAPADTKTQATPTKVASADTVEDSDIG